MSGGSYDYVFTKIEEIDILSFNSSLKRQIFQRLLKLVAQAMHDIEWVDSGDYGVGDEIEAIDACLFFLDIGDSKIKGFAFDDLKRLIENYSTELETK